MKNEQRYHLSRLADALVTEDRFGDSITWEDDQNRRARTVELRPGFEWIFPTVAEADAIRALDEQALASQKILANKGESEAADALGLSLLIIGAYLLAIAVVVFSFKVL